MKNPDSSRDMGIAFAAADPIRSRLQCAVLDPSPPDEAPQWNTYRPSQRCAEGAIAYTN
jgi:hypothetical protein